MPVTKSFADRAHRQSLRQPLLSKRTPPKTRSQRNTPSASTSAFALARPAPSASASAPFAFARPAPSTSAAPPVPPPVPPPVSWMSFAVKAVSPILQAVSPILQAGETKPSKEQIDNQIINNYFWRLIALGLRQNDIGPCIINQFGHFIHPIPLPFDEKLRSIFDYAEKNIVEDLFVGSANYYARNNIKKLIKEGFNSNREVIINDPLMRSLKTGFFVKNQRKEILTRGTKITVPEVLKQNIRPVLPKLSSLGGARPNPSSKKRKSKKNMKQKGGIKRTILNTPYVIVYATLMGTTFPRDSYIFVHISAIIFHEGIMYPFGATNEKVLDGRGNEIPITPLQAVIVSPEKLNPEYQYIVLNFMFLTSQHIKNMEEIFKGVLTANIDDSITHNALAETDTAYGLPARHSILFGESNLFVDPKRSLYSRYVNSQISYLRGLTRNQQILFNCSSIMEIIFGINCKGWQVVPGGFSMPNACRQNPKLLYHEHGSRFISNFDRLLNSMNEHDYGEFENVLTTLALHTR